MEGKQKVDRKSVLRGKKKEQSQKRQAVASKGTPAMVFRSFTLPSGKGAIERCRN
jgi:hypothetical protein